MNLETTKFNIINAEDFDAITNPQNPKNKAAVAMAKETFSKISKSSNFNIVTPKSKKMDLRKRLEILNGTIR